MAESAINPFLPVPLLRLQNAQTSPESLARCEAARTVRAARQFYDPVPYLEALATLRLLADEDVEPEFEDAAHEWLLREWGWGVHLSARGTRQFLAVLACLLLLDADPPYDAHRLFQRLLALDDHFAGLPRVPTTESMLPLALPGFRATLTTAYAEDALCALVQQLGGDALLPTVAAPPALLATPCFGGTVAMTFRSPGGVLGTLSRFPLLPTLPLHRQEHAYPVLFWQDAQSYGYLKWHVFAAHALALPGTNEGTASFPLPETHALQRGGEALVLRLYRVPAGVTRIEDAWEGPGQDRIAARCLPLSKGVLASDRLALAESTLPTVFATLWALSLEGAITASPVLRPIWDLPSVPRTVGEEAWDLDWELPGGLWRVRIDPLEEKPLCAR